MGATRRINAYWAEVDKKDARLMLLIYDRKMTIYPRRGSHWIRVGKVLNRVEAMQLGLRVEPGSALWPNVAKNRKPANPDRALDPNLGPYHTVEEAADAVDVGPERIRQMIRNLELEAHKPSKSFRIPDRAFQALVKRMQPLPQNKGELVHFVQAGQEFSMACNASKFLLQLDCERHEIECYQHRGKGPYFIPRAALDARIAYYQERQRANQSQSA